MSGNEIRLGLDREGNVTAWKIVVGGRTSHRLAKPLFPRHQPNYDFDHGVLLRVKLAYRPGRFLPLGSEYSRRKAD